MNIIKVLAAKNWGSSQRIPTNTYKALIQSKLDYGCMVYGSANNNTLKKLDIILNSSMRIAVGGFRTSPTISLLSESGMIPLNLRREKLTMNYTIRLITNPKNQAINLLHKDTNMYKHAKIKMKYPFYYRAKMLFEKYEIHANDVCVEKPSKVAFWLTESTKISSFCKYDKFLTVNKHKDLYPNYQHITTTSVKLHNSLGTAASLSREEHILLKLPIWLSVQSSLEILIHQIIKETEHSNKNMVIHTDNYNIVKSISENKPTKAITKNITNKLKHLNGQISLYYSDLSIEKQNNLQQLAEYADKLNFAKHPENVDKNDIKKLIDTKVKLEWNNIWTHSNNKSKLRQIKCNVFDKNPAINFKRKDQVLITRLRIGHTKITHQHLLNKENKAECEHCKLQTNIQHILIECPTYETKRKKLKLKRNLTEILNDPTQCKLVVQLINNMNIRHYI